MTPAELQPALQSALDHHQSGRFQQAEDIYRRILAHHPNHPDTTHLLGVLASQVGRLDVAAQLMLRAVALNPSDPRYHGNLARVLAASDHLDEAIVAYRQALKLDSGSADNWYNLGNVLHRTSQFQEAVDAFRESLARSPANADARINLGNSHHALGQYPEATEAFHQAIELQPDIAEAHNNLSDVLRVQGRLDESLAASQRTLELRPDYPEAFNNRGSALIHQLRLEEGIDALRKSLELRPNFALAHFNFGLAMLLKGDFKQGWEHYEWRWRLPILTEYFQDVKQPKWDGGRLEGRRLLLHSEQGYGDTIQIMRFIPQVAQRGGKVLLVCPESLVRLLSGVGGIDSVTAHGQPLPDFDVHCPLLSLPGILQTTLETIPAEVPYLHPDQELSSRWHQRTAGQNLKVGLVWAGRASNQNDYNRSIPLSALAPLANVPGITFFALQTGPGAQQAQSASFGVPVIDCGSELTDFADTAAAMANLDLLITVDTAAAHLAGALGKPVWVLIPHCPDWRWMLDRSDSPWYPTMRLFRQPKPGDWQTPLVEIVQALRSFKIDAG